MQNASLDTDLISLSYQNNNTQVVGLEGIKLGVEGEIKGQKGGRKKQKITLPKRKTSVKGIKGKEPVAKKSFRKGVTRGPMLSSKNSTRVIDLSGIEENVRRAKRRLEIKAGKRPLVAVSHIRNMNRVVIRSEAYMEASKIWDEVKLLGLVLPDKDEEVIEKLVEMEDRDRK